MYVSIFLTSNYERKPCLNWMVSLQVLPHPQLIFPSKTCFVLNLFEFQQQKSHKNQCLLHSKSKSYQINSMKSCSSRSFQQHHRQFLQKNSILFYFQWRNHSISKNSYTASPIAMKPSRCTPPPWKLSKETKNAIWSIPVWWIS